MSTEEDPGSQSPECIHDNVGDQQLNKLSSDCLQVYDEINGTYSELDRSLFDYVINNIERDDTGRIIAPLLWNHKVEHLLANNFHLAKSILFSTVKKLQAKSADVLRQYDEVIQGQLKEGMIERIDNLEQFVRENNNVSFLPHSAVIRESAETTKCRVVFMSNLCERAGGKMSHNEISFPGANLNNPLFDSLLMLRFQKFMITYDICKAFLQIRVRDSDSKKLLFLWVEDAQNGNFNVVAYRFLRLGFGLRFSPNILLCALHYVLLNQSNQDCDRLRELKRRLYSLTYMDNVSYTASNEEDIAYSYTKSIEIFREYKFELQKFFTNSVQLQQRIDRDFGISTPVETGLFGLIWDRLSDTFKSKKLNLNSLANTKKSILSTLNAQFDLLGIYLPIILNAKFFMHSLQTEHKLGWNDPIGEDLQKEWQRICNRVNDHSEFVINRNMGERDSHFNLIVCCDSSKLAMGCVVYLWNLATGKISFMFAKSRMIGANLKTKSIPVLELVSMAWAVELAMQNFRILTASLEPITIDRILVLSDSSIALSWVKSRAVKFEKIEKKAVIINNKVNKILTECETKKVEFFHIDGCSNPADFASRATSNRALLKSNFHTGPNLDSFLNDVGAFSVPHSQDENVACIGVTAVEFQVSLINLDKHSSFEKCTRILNYAFLFWQNLKNTLATKYESRFGHLKSKQNTYVLSKQYLIRKSQERAYPRVFQFFNGELKKADPIVTQLNIGLDRKGILRVKSKLGKANDALQVRSPMLLSKSCNITKSIIADQHQFMQHAQVLKLLASIRRNFYIPNAYSTVKKSFHRCVICKKNHGRSLRVNTNDYRDFRVDPGSRPFTTVMIDFIGPYYVKNELGQECNRYICLITCMFTRAINLSVCPTVDTESVLRALQLHVFDYGIMQSIIADNQPSFASSFKYMSGLLAQTEISNYLKTNNINLLDYQPYPSGASFLGGAVESLVGQVKEILNVSVGKQKVKAEYFDFAVAEAKCLVNKRPIAFKELLSSNDIDSDMPFALSPEILLKGYEVPSFNILPLQSDDEESDPTWVPSSESKNNFLDLYKKFASLSKARTAMHTAYEHEFLRNLEMQATDKPNRYKKVNQIELKKGDLVAVKTKLIKPFHYPYAVVQEIEYNDVNEINAIKVRKANGEIIRRHPTDIIPLLSCSNNDDTEEHQQEEHSDEDSTSVRPLRQAKLDCMEANKKLNDLGLV